MNQLPQLFTIWNYDDPAETAEKFLALLPQAEAGADRGYHVELLTQIARTHSLQRQFAAAHRWLDEAEALLTPGMSVPRMRCLLERGRTYNSAGEPESARPLFAEAYTLGTAVSPQADFYTIDAAHMMAIVEPTPAEQLKWNETALALAKASPNKRAAGWCGSLYNNLGWAYHDKGDYEQALAIFEQALAWHLQFSTAESEKIRIAKWCIGRALRSLSRLPEALAIQQALLADYQQRNQPAGFTNEEIGECLLAMGQEAAARPYFAQAHKELSQVAWVAATEQERLARLAELGGNG